jgi:hypothetical protein
MTDNLGLVDPATVEELRSLSFRYASGVDRRDLDLFLSAFHPDATLTVKRATARTEPPPPMSGHAEIGRVIERIGIYPQTFHFLGQSGYALTAKDTSGEVARLAPGPGVSAATSHRARSVASPIAPIPTGAFGEISCVAHHRWQDDGDFDHVMYIRYADEYRVGDDDRWRISARTVVVDWSETRTLDVSGRRPR